MFRPLIIGIGLFLVLQPDYAAMASTICSNPKRERVLATARIELQKGGMDRLNKQLQRSSARIGMTTYDVGTEESGANSFRSLGMQSPKASVAIEADWTRGQRSVVVRVKRTCIDDSLEPWQGYWERYKREVRRAGYVLH